MNFRSSNFDYYALAAVKFISFSLLLQKLYRFKISLLVDYARTSYVSHSVSHYTYYTAAILIRNYLIISEVLSPTIPYSPPSKLLNLAYYCKSYIALKSGCWIPPVPATPATYDLRCSLRTSEPATPEPRDY